MVELLVQHGADTNTLDIQCQTPLHVVAANNAVGSVHCLLSIIDDVNVADQSRRTALHHAAYHRHSQVAIYQIFHQVV